MASGDVSSARKKPRWRWYQFGLRSLLIFMAILVVGLGLVGIRLQAGRRERFAVEAMSDWGVNVYYDYQLDSQGRRTLNAALPGPPWLREHLGEDFYRHVQEIYLQDLSSKRLLDDDLQHLERLPYLESIELISPGVTDAGLEHFQGLRRLKALHLHTPQITDAGLDHLAGLTQLTLLTLDDTQVTDAGLEKLTGLTQLKSLNLAGTQVTPAGIAKLQTALPRCRISR